MANDLTTLQGKLAEQLRDTGHETWSASEKNDLIRWAVADLAPGIMKYTTFSQAADNNTNFITMGGDFASIHRIDMWDADPTSGVSRMVMEIPGRMWEVQQSIEPGTDFRVAISPRFTMTGYYYLVHGYVPYNTDTNLIPDRLVSLVLAKARAEAYRRMGGDRARFENWLTQSERQDVSVNELLQLTREAQVEADSLMIRNMGHKKPVTARR